jgi:hypothetical protein
MPQLPLDIAKRTAEYVPEQRETRRPDKTTRSLKGTPDTESISNAHVSTADFLGYLWGDVEGWVSIDVGTYVDGGRHAPAYKHPRMFEWPAQRDALIEYANGLVGDVCMSIPVFTADSRARDNVATVRVLYQDLDAGKNEEQREEALAFFREHGTITCSGAGRQAYVLLPSPVDVGTADDLLKRMCARFGGDSGAKGVNRIFKLPNTNSYKHREGCAGVKSDAADRECGCPIRPTYVETFNATPISAELVAEISAWPIAEPSTKDSAPVARGEFDVRQLPARVLSKFEHFDNIVVTAGGVSEARSHVFRYAIENGVDSLDVLAAAEVYPDVYGDQQDARLRNTAWQLREIRKARESASVVSTGAAKVGLASELLTLADLDKMPAPTWLVRDVLTNNSLVQLHGQPKTLKSFIALDMALSIGADRAWQGHKVRAGRVVYLAAEGAPGMRKRVKAWCLHNGVDASDIDIRIMPRAVQVADDEWQAYVELCRELEPVLIVLDTQARITVGQEENSAKDMGVLTARVDELKVATGACVMLVHHQGHAGGRGRGSSSVWGAVDTELSVERSKETNIVKLKMMSQKDAEEIDPIEFAPKSIDTGMVDEDGRPVTSLVLERGGNGGRVKVAVADVKTVKGKIEIYLRNNAGQAFTNEQIATAIGCSLDSVRKMTLALVKGNGNVMSTGEGKEARRYSVPAELC